MTEPLGMLAHPGMVGRALNCKVECDFESEAPRGQDKMIEIVQAAERRLDRRMTAGLAADRPGAAGTVGERSERVVGPLAIRVADRMNRREVHDVEAEVANFGQPPLGLAQRRS